MIIAGKQIGHVARQGRTAKSAVPAGIDIETTIATIRPEIDLVSQSKCTINTGFGDEDHRNFDDVGIAKVKGAFHLIDIVGDDFFYPVDIPSPQLLVGILAIAIKV